MLDGTRQILEDLAIFAEADFDLLRVDGTEQVVQRVELENQGSGQPLVGSNLDDFRFRDSLVQGTGGSVSPDKVVEMLLDTVEEPKAEAYV